MSYILLYLSNTLKYDIDLCFIHLKGEIQMRNILLTALFLASSFSITVDEATGWEYDQSTLQAFYMLEILTIDGQVADSEDVVGAFFDGICVGFINADPNGYTTVPLMGNDGGDYDYLNVGEVPDLFVYDASNGSILPIVPASELAGWAINEIFTIDGTSTASNTFGCTDDSACNYDSDATADDDSCLYNDCFGECGGSAVVDDCGVCNGENADQDCAGECFGDASEDCAGVCNGAAYVDNCGECDDDSSNDDLSCSGCTDSCADNYDDSATIEDDSCEYSVDAIDDLVAASGPSRVILSWTAPSSVCGVTSYNVYDTGDAFVKETSSTSTQIVGLDAGVEYCFTVKAVTDDAESDFSNEACATPEASEGLSWGLNLSAEINGWGSFIETDDANKLGVSPAASYGYDGAFDAPEPPAGGSGNWVSLYFPHPEWGNQWGDNFTQDVVLEDDEFFQSNLTVWPVEVLSNMSGQTTVTFEHIQTPIEVPMFVEVIQGDGDSDPLVSEITDGSSVSFFLSQGIPQKLNVVIGNRPPTVSSDALSADGGDRSISLEWVESDGRYGAESYSIYREGAGDVVGLTSASYIDNEDREGHDGQGLLYESTWSYELTASNAAGESTDGYSIRTSGGDQENIDGTSAVASATTDNNLDPVSVPINAYCWTGCEGENGEYSAVHDGNGDENNEILIVFRNNSYDDDENDEIDRYNWIIDGDVYSISPDFTENTSQINITTGIGHDQDAKEFIATLTVESDYPIKGGVGTRSHTASVNATLSEEPNEDPIAPDALSLIVGDDGLSVATLLDLDDGNDYDSNAQLWYVPHDGDPQTTTASLSFDASASFDADGDELTYSWSLIAGEDLDWSYGDLNQNGVYDIGEPVFEYGGGEVYINPLEVSTDITYLDNLPSDVYVLELTVTDAYGDSDKSVLVVGVEEERNEAPTVEAGDDQVWYMPTGQDLFDISMSSHSVDDLDSDLLSYSWDLDGSIQNSLGNQSSPYLELENDNSLSEGEYVFTLTVSDSYGESGSDSFTVTVLNEPAPVAANSLGIDDADNAFKQIQISWQEGVLQSDFDGAYTGDLHNTLYFIVSMNGEERATYQNDAGDGATYTHHERSLDAGSDYEFTVEAFNSDDEGGAVSVVSQTTHARPEVNLINPNGGEIYSVGDDYTVEFSTTNDRFISSIDIQFLGSDGQWSNEDENANVFSNTGTGNDSKTYIGSISSEGSEIHNGAAIKVIVTDIGDADGANKESNEDASSSSFTLAAHTISKSFNDGWNLFGSILDVSDGPNGELMVDNLSASFGNWGEYWVAYDADGQYENLSLSHGEGFYLALAEDDILVLEGDPVVGDPENGALATIELIEGWNLIANPLVLLTAKSEISVEYDGVTLPWEDAVNAGWIAPSINGWFGDSHFPYEVLHPGGGYWVNTSRDLSLHFTTDDGSSEDLARGDNSNSWNMKLNASSLDGESFGDYLVIGLADNADSKFKYGEDEYDLPNPRFGNKSSIDIHVNNDNLYLYRDIKSTDFQDYQVWNISADMYGLSKFKLDWDMGAIDSDVHLVVEGDIIDMKAQDSIMLSSLDESSIVVGNIGSFLEPVPSQFGLGSAYPNPFNPTTTLNLDLNYDSFVDVSIYSVTGQLVANLISNDMSAGYHAVNWDASNVASGVYIVKVIAGSNVASQKVMLLK